MKKNAPAFLLHCVILTTLTLGVINPVSAQPTLTFATDQWPPFYGPQLEKGGFLTELTKQVFQQAGYQVDIKFMPWNRALEGANRGIYDGLLGAYYTPQRARKYIYSAPLATERTVLVSRTELAIHYRELKDLQGYSIGVRRGAIHSPEFDQADFLKREYSNSADQNIRRLLFGRLDLIVTGQTQLNTILQESYTLLSDKVEVLEPPLKVNRVFLALGRHKADHQHIITAFNRALTAFQQSGEFSALQQNYGLNIIALE